MSVTLGTVAAKAAQILLTDKRTWKAMAAIVAGLAMICVLPVMVLLSMFGGVTSSGLDSAAMRSLASDLTSSQAAQMRALDSACAAIASEITAQDAAVDPAKAQLIYVCGFLGREQAGNDFYARYVQCLARAPDDNAVFDNLTETFGVSFPADERAEILSLYDHIR